MREIQHIAIVLTCTILLTGCQPKPAPREGARKIRLATTSSTENSGLLDVLLPAFRRKTGIEVQVLPMGTGKALRTAHDGNCDAVLVHDRKAEEKFIREGWGVDRRGVMYNDFVILGPRRDPAGVKGMRSAAAALKKIAAVRAVFISRGDNSGTYKKELELWDAIGLVPSGDWYCSVGKGMGGTLTMANELYAYVLVDRGTFIKFRKRIDLVVLVEGDEVLFNPYSVIAVNPRKHSHVNYHGATKFIDFLTSEEGQKLIGDYTLQGETLFHPWSKDTKPRTIAIRAYKS